jgi:hypothetical protein
MKKRAVILPAAISSFIGHEVNCAAQEQFKKLSGAEIRARFVGMEFTNEVHGGRSTGRMEN